MTRPDRIPDPRQKIRYWVGQTHSFSFIPRSSVRRGGPETCGNVYYSCQSSVVSFQQIPLGFAPVAS